jgi:hypothetical protein
MKCHESGCHRNKIWAHFNGRPYCQYHYKANQNKERKVQVLKLIDHVESLGLKDARIAKLLDYELIDQVRGLFTRGPGRPQATVSKAKAKRILDELASNEEALSVLESLLKKLPTKK